jgi:hypothetical protein
MTQLLPGARSGATLGDFNFAFNSGDSLSRSTGRARRTRCTRRQRSGGAHPRRRRDHRRRGQRRRGTGNASAHGRLLGGIRQRLGRPDPHCDQERNHEFPRQLYEYLRNSAMNANTWTRNLNPATQFAFSLCLQQFWIFRGRPGLGPRCRLRPAEQGFSSSSTKIGSATASPPRSNMTVPTALMRQGNFSELLSANPWYAGGTSSTCPGPARCRRRNLRAYPATSFRQPN